MKLKSVSLFAISFAFVLLSINMSFAQEKKIEKKDLPSAVLSSFQKSYPNAEIKGTSMEKENGKTYYEIESMDGLQRRDLLYTKNGTVAEIEEKITSENLPEQVKNSVSKKYPDSEIKSAEKTTRNSKVTYELIVESKKGKAEVIVSPNGNIQKVEKMKKENEEKEGKENNENEEEE